MEEIIQKANTLIEALPYIQKFNGKIIVVKYGGSAMVDDDIKENVIRDISLLKLVGFKPIVVHGGGKEISKWINKIGKETVFKQGLRVTDEETMELAEMVLGKVNKNLVQLIQQLGVKAVGISGKDAATLKVKKQYIGGEDIGFVGEITRVNKKLIQTLVENNYIPVIAPIGLDDNYDTYNINADDVACAVAKSMNAEKLVFLTDIEGVYSDPRDKSTLISELRVKDAEKFINSGLVGGGMLPKLRNCVDAVEDGVSKVHILDGRLEHCLLLEIFTRKGIGTAILE